MGALGMFLKQPFVARGYTSPSRNIYGANKVVHVSVFYLRKIYILLKCFNVLNSRNYAKFRDSL
jgi:hypothetical protein